MNNKNYYFSNASVNDRINKEKIKSAIENI